MEKWDSLIHNIKYISQKMKISGPISLNCWGEGVISLEGNLNLFWTQILYYFCYGHSAVICLEIQRAAKLHVHEPKSQLLSTNRNAPYLKGTVSII